MADSGADIAEKGWEPQARAASAPAPSSQDVSAEPKAPLDSRHHILEAAAHCFKENGFAATSIDDVARSLGATKGMIYHHYRSKTDLFFAVYRRGMEINEEATRPFVDAEGPALERLAKMSHAHAIALMAHQSFQRVLGQGVAMHQTGSTTAAQRETLIELIAIRDRYEAQFRSLIEAAANETGGDVENLSVATKSFLSVLNGTVFWYSQTSEDPKTEQNYLARQLVIFALRGLGVELSRQSLDYMELTQ